MSNVISDLNRILNRLQTVIRYTLASALQLTLNHVFEAKIQFCVVLISCINTEVMVRILNKKWMKLLREICIIQAGQSFLTFSNSIFYDSDTFSMQASTWLLQSSSLCILGVILYNDKLTQAKYIQNAVYVYIYTYVNFIRDKFMKIDFGTSQFYISLLFLMLSVWICRYTLSVNAVYKYLLQAVHIMIVDMFFTSTQNKIKTWANSTQLLGQLLSLLFIDSIYTQFHEPDDITNESDEEDKNKQKQTPVHNETQLLLSQVRSYALWRVARDVVLYELILFDLTTCIALAIFFFCFRQMSFIQEHMSSKSIETISELFLLASINIALQPITNISASQVSSVLFLKILFINIIAQYIEKIVVNENNQKNIQKYIQK
jgi:hypothetical protein